MSVEIAYAMDEMVKEGEADPDLLYEDAAHVFQAMFHYPDYAPQNRPALPPTAPLPLPPLEARSRVLE
jgi:hypothetical protein